MLLAVDIGNTNVVVGIFDGGSLRTAWRLETEHGKMADEWWALLATLAAQDGLDPQGIGGAILCSGVPRLTTTFLDMIQHRLGLRPIEVTSTIDLGIRVLTDNPAEVGPDRLANAVAAQARYDCPAVVVDCGTATTLDVISTEGDYLGGAIAPGVTVSFDALTRHAARLSAVPLVPPPHAIGRNTTEAIQSGTVLGYLGLIEGLLTRVAAELPSPPTVIATGGLGQLFAQHSAMIHAYEPNLTLYGLHLIYARQRR